MKTLTLIRHAKSDWGNPALKDIDRHLNERGYANAYAMSEWLAAHIQKPDGILSSTALRALSTSLIFARAMNFGMKHFFPESELYENSPQNILSVIQRMNNAYSNLLVFGHNPWMTELANDLLHGYTFGNIPTCGMVSMKFETTDWKKIGSAPAHLDFKKFPKEPD